MCSLLFDSFRGDLKTMPLPAKEEDSGLYALSRFLLIIDEGAGSAAMAVALTLWRSSEADKLILLWLQSNLQPRALKVFGKEKALSNYVAIQSSQRILYHLKFV